MRIILIPFIALLTLVACSNDDDRGEIDRNAIIEYLAENNLDAEEDDSGVFYIIEDEGDDRKPGPDEVVTISYEGFTLGNGTKIDETGDRDITISLASVIRGFQEGLQYIGRGGRIILFIPSGLAFGSQPPAGIPANAVVRYIVDLKEDQSIVDNQTLVDYLADNEISTLEHESGIFYNITMEGDGQNPSLTDRVSVKYRGTLLDGTQFDATPDGQTSRFVLNTLIEGWQIAIPLLSRGGAGTFYIPSQLCYGSFPPSGIPANAILIFEIELLDF